MITTDVSSWRVLVVDDEPDNLQLVCSLLEFKGAVVASAHNGTSALEMADAFQPNIILLDLAMPRMDGWEAHEKFRAKPDYAQMPIVALTAHAMPEDIERAMKAGFDAYIIKPFRLATLLEELVRCVEHFLAESG